MVVKPSLLEVPAKGLLTFLCHIDGLETSNDSNSLGIGVGHEPCSLELPLLLKYASRGLRFVIESLRSFDSRIQRLPRI